MNKDTFIGFRVSNRPSCPHLDPPLVLRELYCSVGTKRVLSKTEKVSAFKSVFVPILVMNLRWRLKNIDKRTDGRDGIFAKSPRCDTSWQGAQVWNLWSPEYQATSPNREIPAVLVRPCIQNVPGKNCELSLSGYSLHQGRNQLFISGGGAIFMKFIRWCHRAYSTVVQLFRKRSHIIIMYFCPQTRSP